MSGYNYVINPSLETNTTGYTASGATFARDSLNTLPGTGTYCGKVTATGTATHSVSVPVTVVSGNTYTASAYVKISTATPSYNIAISVTGGSTIRTFSTNVKGGWKRIYTLFTASSSSITLTIGADTDTVTLNDTFYFDRVKVTDGKLPGPYFDGSYPFTTWAGTAHASVSHNVGFDANNQFSSDDPILADGLCLNTFAFMSPTKTGRFATPSFRGSNNVIPGGRGSVFVANKPTDDLSWNLSLIVLGANPDGTVPSAVEQRQLFDANLTALLQAVIKSTSTVTVAAWQPDGTCRIAGLTVNEGFDLDLQMGGRRAELIIPFDVVSGTWLDAIPATIAGTAGTAWSNQSLVLTRLAGGQATIEDSIVTVTGPITNPRVTDPISGVWTQYTGTVAAGSTWVIDSGAFTSKIGATSVLSSTTHFGHRRFIVIDPGTSFRVPALTLTGTATSSATNLSVTASRQHWGA